MTAVIPSGDPVTSEEIRVAIATKTGEAVDEHFGHAKHFDVYCLNGGEIQFLARRQVAHYCLGGHSDKSAMPKILETIKDCQAVFVARIGDGPNEKLEARGIMAITDYPWETVKEALENYVSLTTYS